MIPWRDLPVAARKARFPRLLPPECGPGVAREAVPRGTLARPSGARARDSWPEPSREGTTRAGPRPRARPRGGARSCPAPGAVAFLAGNRAPARARSGPRLPVAPEPGPRWTPAGRDRRLARALRIRCYQGIDLRLRRPPPGR